MKKYGNSDIELWRSKKTIKLRSLTPKIKSLLQNAVGSTRRRRNKMMRSLKMRVGNSIIN